MGSSVWPAVRRPQEKLGPAIGRPQRGKYLGMGTSVRPANGAHRRSWGQPSGSHRGMIESEGGYLREASRQAPTGEGAASQRRPQKRETSVGPAIRRPQEKVRPAIVAPTGHSEACHRGAHSVVSQRRPQVWSAVVALTVRPAITALTMFISIKLPSKTNTCF